MNRWKEKVNTILDIDYNKDMHSATTLELYNAVSKAAMSEIGTGFAKECLHSKDKKVCYMSIEYLIGRMVYNNLMNLGLFNQFNELMTENGRDIRELEDIDDAALGNGGLGRLAACFLDSGATIGITMNGYGLRYRYGLFRQTIVDGFQKEEADDWQRFGDPWSVRNEEDKCVVRFAGSSVYAVPYDMPVIGYGGKKINTLRLWQAEPVEEFNFEIFNDQKYDEAVKNKNEADIICDCLYPNDSTDEGRILRLKQQYFFASATMQNIVRAYKSRFGDDFSRFPQEYAIQLNDTHPVVAVPELMRILIEECGMTNAKAIKLIRESFAYTNHTIMAEAMEKWDIHLFKSLLPNVYKYVTILQKMLIKEITPLLKDGQTLDKYNIIDGNLIHMARMAIFSSHSTNGVAQIHTEILKNDVLKEWYEIYPARFNNKTNGITQRRWLLLSNMELAGFISDKIGNAWITDLDNLKKLEKFADDKNCIRRFDEIKRLKKRQLADYVQIHENVKLNPDFIFDIQMKRLHEYKRQLLNAFAILDIYYGIKDGRIRDFHPTAFIFGAKAAPGYFRAKGIIKYINEIGKMIEDDPEVRGKLQVIFVQNYNVSYAEKLVPAADVSEQISTAGTEASGTGNMKLMLNGAVTLGTLDGANVEIVQEAGEDNNYIFGAKVDEIDKIRDTYNSKKLYTQNPRLKRVVDTLIDGTFDDGGTGMFKELYDSLLKGASWHKPDHYFIFLDFDSYVDAKLKINKEYSDTYLFRRKCFMNTANAGRFSSDRTIRDYVREVW